MFMSYDYHYFNMIMMVLVSDVIDYESYEYIIKKRTTLPYNEVVFYIQIIYKVF